MEVEAYGHSQGGLVKHLFSPAERNSIPRHRVTQLDPESLQRCFLSWVESVADLREGTVVAIGGKTLRQCQCYDRDRGKGAIHRVSAWAVENRLVLGQVKVDEASNEITAIPEAMRSMVAAE